MYPGRDIENKSRCQVPVFNYLVVNISFNLTCSAFKHPRLLNKINMRLFFYYRTSYRTEREYLFKYGFQKCSLFVKKHVKNEENILKLAENRREMLKNCSVLQKITKKLQNYAMNQVFELSF